MSHGPWQIYQFIDLAMQCRACTHWTMSIGHPAVLSKFVFYSLECHLIGFIIHWMVADGQLEWHTTCATLSNRFIHNQLTCASSYGIAHQWFVVECMDSSNKLSNQNDQCDFSHVVWGLRCIQLASLHECGRMTHKSNEVNLLLRTLEHWINFFFRTYCRFAENEEKSHEAQFLTWVI